MRPYLATRVSERGGGGLRADDEGTKKKKSCRLGRVERKAGLVVMGNDRHMSKLARLLEARLAYLL